MARRLFRGLSVARGRDVTFGALAHIEGALNVVLEGEEKEGNAAGGGGGGGGGGAPPQEGLLGWEADFPVWALSRRPIDMEEAQTMTPAKVLKTQTFQLLAAQNAIPTLVVAYTGGDEIHGSNQAWTQTFGACDSLMGNSCYEAKALTYYLLGM